ncbi:flavin monoamine oxidase family protein [Nocardia thailandica]|uniref:flavin monoamine oxidase family protein n=1 Tax=Nocardia thailandica TaxID=257275 RepID=UPI000312AA05|nr:FAD-dependent oxidoreductase [Nocardia thailandica]
MTDHDNPPPATADVVVVGAGMSGLVAARALHRRGVDVLVLESAGRPGGRMLAETTALGSRVDLGGQWIGAGHHRFAALAAECGATVFPMRTPKRPAMLDGDRAISQVGPTALTALAVLAVWEIAARTGAPLGRDHTVADWVRRVPGARARRLLEVVVGIATTADTDRLSMGTFLDAVRFQGGLPTMLTTAGGAQDSLVAEGAGSLIEHLAAGLAGRVRYDSRVTALRRDDTGVTVYSAAGTVRAGRVVVTVPPPVAAAIEHEPPLPGSRIRLQDDTSMGSVYKAIAVYDRPFWRERAHAELLSTDTGAAVFDTSPPDGPGHLCLLVAGPDARALDALDPAARRALLLGPPAGRLGRGVLDPRDWHEKAWHRDEHAGGGYTAFPRPGYAPGLPFPAEPLGRLHWAGTETASAHAGYIEGAIEAGERTAREVLAARG